MTAAIPSGRRAPWGRKAVRPGTRGVASAPAVHAERAALRGDPRRRVGGWGDRPVPTGSARPVVVFVSSRAPRPVEASVSAAGAARPEFTTTGASPMSPQAHVPLRLHSTAAQIWNLALGLLLLPALGASAAAQECNPTPQSIRFTYPAGSLGEIVVGDGIAYVDAYSLPIGYAIHIYDVSNPSSPQLLGYIGPNAGWSGPMWLSGSTLYTGALSVYDVSNPVNPVLLGSRNLTCCQNVNGRVVVGSVAYMGNFNSLRTVDVSAPAFMPVLDDLTVTGYAIESIAVQDNLVYIVNRTVTASSPGGLHIVDATDPGNLSLVSTLPITGTGLAVEGNYAYVAGGVGQGLRVVDISNPAAPQLVGNGATPLSGIYEVVVSGSRAYAKLVNYNGLAVYDISNPTNPIFLTSRLAASGPSAGGSNGDIAVVDGVAYTTTHQSFAIFDVLSCEVSDTPPTANAGADFSVDEGQAGVMLDGSGSSDPDNDPLTYAWEQVGVATVPLTGASTDSPSFDAPFVTANTTLTFRLTVTANGVDATDTVNVTVVNVNHVPVADAGEDQSVAEGAPDVALKGSDSYDDDMDALTYSWLQIGGPAVSLSSATVADPTFDAPYVAGSGAPGVVATLDFQLTVEDGFGGSSTDTVSVDITNVNNVPTAAAGADQTVDENTPVSLAGGGSSDPDGDALSYSWTQTYGTGVVLTGADTATPSFTAPFVIPGGGDLAFQLTVSDGYGGLATDQVVVHVQNINDPPLVTAAAPTVGSLWPPTHGLVSVGITGVSDPDGNATITIDAVYQDEPTNGLGDGDTAIDAIINPDGTVLLRAERSALGNGRVYHIHFTASDPEGSVTGVVTVSVPKSKKGVAVDDGALYDSTL